MNEQPSSNALLNVFRDRTVNPTALAELAPQMVELVESLQQSVAEQTARGDQLNRELSAFLKVGRAQPPNEALALLAEVRMPPCVDDPVVWAGVSADWFRRRDTLMNQVSAP